MTPVQYNNDNNIQTTTKVTPTKYQVGTGSEDVNNNDVTDDDCGPDCQNLLHELDHPREDERCSGPGQVIDIWGYCRSVVDMGHHWGHFLIVWYSDMTML